MIAYNNVRLIKKILGPKFEPNRQKSSSELGFLPFSQAWFIIFFKEMQRMIAWNL